MPSPDTLRQIAEAHVRYTRLTDEADAAKNERDKLASTTPLNRAYTVVLEDGTAVLIERDGFSGREYAISEAVA